MKKNLMLFVLLPLCVCPAAAGNRADVNADRAVNAADSVCLANILAGNLDASEFNLENVVVVAPQGGDFTDPTDAADWVATQNPTWDRRFVILVTPGVYELTRAIWLPSFTALRGYGKDVSFIRRDGGTASPPFGAIVVVNSCDDCAIEDLKLSKGTGGTSYSAAVYIFDSSVTIKDCDLYLNSSVAWGAVIYSLGSSGVSISGTYIYATDNTAPGDLINSVAGIYMESLAAYPSALLELRHSEIRAINDSGTPGTHQYAYATVLNVDTTNKQLQAMYSFLWSQSNTAGDEYYLYRNASGTALLHFCFTSGATNSEGSLSRIMCN